jgi:general secretion pathway protein H
MTRISALTDRSEGHETRDRRAGFTLMEVVLAMLIMGMLAILALPYFRPGAGLAVVTAKASEIASLLRRDRNATLRLGGAGQISVDIEAGIIGSERLGQTVRMPVGVSLRILPERIRSVRFLAEGGSSGARIILTSKSSTLAIDVNKVTASIQIVEIKR